ncbi:MAG: hypothetical protein ACI4RD_10045 [Kiritimatiellia bacterium]
MSIGRNTLCRRVADCHFACACAIAAAWYAAIPALAASSDAASSDAAPAAEAGAWPKIWTSFNWGGNLEAQFADMASHGIEVVEVPVWNEAVCRQALALCRAHGLKAYGFTDEPSCSSRPALRGKPYACAEYVGGCFRGRAIDRTLYAFSPEPQDILVEPPVYASGQPYTRRTADSNGTVRVTRHGHYFSQSRPVRAEVIVPLKLYDGAQHLEIIPVAIEPPAPGQALENDTATGAMCASAEVARRRLVRLRFDLTPYAGARLDQVGIAVYWSSDPASAAWRNGRGQMSVFAPATRAEAVHTVSFRLRRWRDANGGTFPSDVFVALRFGDECFNVTGWLDSPAASYPLFDYSADARAAFAGLAPAGVEMPRTWGYPEVYGAEAYGLFLYNYHRAAAELSAAAVAAAREIAPGVKVFRNTTRGEVWSYCNDHDGSGQELLAGVFDFIHGDPYPVRNGYNAETIPFDMGYLAGLARRYGKPLVPWVQAHAYSPCGLGHVTSGQLERMWRQHAAFAPAAIIYLGYGRGERAHCAYTFPDGNPASWEKAAELHRAFRAAPSAVAGRARLAVVRPYTVRALACDTGEGAVRNPADALLAAFVRAWSVDHGQAYDVFEVPPVETPAARAARAAALAGYAYVVSTAPGDGARVIGAGTVGRVYSREKLEAFRRICREEIARAQGECPCPDAILFSSVP